MNRSLRNVPTATILPMRMTQSEVNSAKRDDVRADTAKYQSPTIYELSSHILGVTLFPLPTRYPEIPTSTMAMKDCSSIHAGSARRTNLFQECQHERLAPKISRAYVSDSNIRILSVL